MSLISRLFGKGDKRRTNRGRVYSISDCEWLDENGEIINCNYEFATKTLIKQLGGGILPKELVGLLEDYSQNPCVATAMDLILFDVAMILVFVNSQRSAEFAQNAQGS